MKKLDISRKQEGSFEVARFPDGKILSVTPISNTPKGMEKSHEYKTTEFYAHDYREMAMSEDTLMDMLEGYAEALQCDHTCSSNCRRNGCNCACGEYHF